MTQSSPILPRLPLGSLNYPKDPYRLLQIDQLCTGNLTPGSLSSDCMRARRRKQRRCVGFTP